MLDAVIFDWGGTLAHHADVDVRRLWAPAALVLAEAEARGADVDPMRVDALCTAFVAVEAETWSRVRDDQASTTLERIVAEACRRLDVGLGGDPRALDAATAAHLGAWAPLLVHRPSAAPLLTSLRADGLATGLLSNTHWPRRFHQQLLERDGLDDLIDASAYTCELSRMKPHPLAFRAILQMLHVADPRRAVYVGDRPYDDCYGARQMGMRTIRVRGTHIDEHDVPDALVYADYRADAVVDDLDEIPDWVARWSQP